MLKPRARKVADLAEHGRYFFVPPVAYDETAVKKHLSTPGICPHAGGLGAQGRWSVEPFAPPAIETALRSSADASGVKAGDLIHATRIAITGQG